MTSLKSRSLLVERERCPQVGEEQKSEIRALGPPSNEPDKVPAFRDR